jgi:hypothetical protein
VYPAAAPKIKATLAYQNDSQWPRPVYVQPDQNGEVPAALQNPRDTMSIVAPGIWVLQTHTDDRIVYIAANEAAHSTTRKR